MYEYLKDFNTFYDTYIRLHNYTVDMNGDFSENADLYTNKDMIRDTHSSVSSVYIKIIDHYGGMVDYVSLMYDDRFLFDEMSAIISRHFSSGVRFEYLISGINLLNACFFEMTIASGMPCDEKIIMLENLRKISGAYNVVAVSIWSSLESKRNEEFISSRNERLYLELERFSRYIDSRSSIIMFIDNEGRLLRANKSAKKYFAVMEDFRRYNIMDILDYHFIPFDVFISKYNSKELKSIRLMNGEKFDIGVFPLIYKDGRPSEYVVTLKNMARLKRGGGPFVRGRSLKGKRYKGHAYTSGREYMPSYRKRPFVKGNSLFHEYIGRYGENPPQKYKEKA